MKVDICVLLALVTSTVAILPGTCRASPQCYNPPVHSSACCWLGLVQPTANFFLKISQFSADVYLHSLIKFRDFEEISTQKLSAIKYVFYSMYVMCFMYISLEVDTSFYVPHCAPHLICIFCSCLQWPVELQWKVREDVTITEKAPPST